MLDTTNRVQLAFSDLDETLKTDSGNSIAALLYVDVTDVESGGCGVEDGCARRLRTAVSTAGALPRFRTAAAALRLRLSTSAERRDASPRHAGKSGVVGAELAINVQEVHHGD